MTTAGGWLRVSVRQSMLERIALAGVVVLLFMPAVADAQILRGRVTDHATGAPLADVIVELADVGGRDPVRATTAETGEFSIRIPRDGTFILRANRIGFQPFQSNPVELSVRDLVEVSLELSVEPVELNPVLVTIDRDSNLAEFERRRLRGGTGHFITRPEIERRPVSRPSELLAGVRGVTLMPILDPQGIPGDRYIIWMQGGARTCKAHVFVNGMETTQTGSDTVDDLLNSDWLGGVEVYSTETATPAEYQRPGCGSILFWLQSPESGSGWGWLKGVAAAGFILVAAILTR